MSKRETKKRVKISTRNISIVRRRKSFTLLRRRSRRRHHSTSRGVTPPQSSSLRVLYHGYIHRRQIFFFFLILCPIRDVAQSSMFSGRTERGSDHFSYISWCLRQKGKRKTKKNRKVLFLLKTFRGVAIIRPATCLTTVQRRNFFKSLRKFSIEISW